MKYLIIIPKYYLKMFLSFLISIIIVVSTVLLKSEGTFVYLAMNEEIQGILENYFRQRCTALISGDAAIIQNQFDMSSKYGKWSYEHEIKRINFVRDWCTARGTKFLECETKLKIFSIKGGKDAVKVYLSDITRMAYIYVEQDDRPLNEFCYGTRHSINLVNKDGVWYITVDWYNDPLEDSMPEPGPASAEAMEIREASAYSWVKYNRAKAVEYADKYCGANFYLEDGYKYNKKYRNFADLGGDCANFASQVLSDSQAGGIPMGGGWLYKNGEASASWVNAGAFTHNMLYSGRAKLVSKGKYEKVADSARYISPGDIIAYEKKGDIVHVSIVTAVDSMGVPLVNSHTNDRYHVPWDLGWNSNNVIFWFLKING